jgi:predicted dehydrogenase
MDVEDTAEIGLRFVSGAIGGVHINYVQRPPVHRLEIVGTNGTLRWDNADGGLHFYQIPVPFGSYSDNPPAPIVESFSLPEGFDRNDLFLAQTRHFINIICGGEEPICALEDGIRIQELVQAARESETGGQLMEFRK